MPPQRSTTATSSGVEVWEAAQLPAAAEQTYAKDYQRAGKTFWLRWGGMRDAAPSTLDPRRAGAWCTARTFAPIQETHTSD
ncbi:hypothetical protein FCN77_14670 [Arthrobacter sp. 24S4-2]|nr:hypothetical protein FCN77_14670 [Arthrobacter sp. 24S4-2]